MTSATFAGIPWASNPDTIKSLLNANEFTIVNEENGEIEAKGKILGRHIKACLEYDVSASCYGLYRVSLFSRTALPVDRRKEFEFLLVEKYGAPNKQSKDFAQWESAETTGGTRIVLSMQGNPKGMTLDYLSSEYLAMLSQTFAQNAEEVSRQEIEQRNRAKEML